MSKNFIRVLIGVLVLAFVLTAGVLLRSASKTVENLEYPKKFSEYIEPMAQENGISPSLVYAVVRTESNFQPDAESNVGARGLMQLTKETFEWIDYRRGASGSTWDDMYDPETNLDYGTFLLSQLIEEFGSIENALAAYHAGWNAVKGWMKDPEISPDGRTLENIPYKDTAHYLSKVTKAIEGYQKTYDME